LHRPLYKLQLVRRDEVAAASYAGAVIVAWWKKLRRPLEDLKDLNKMGIAAIALAPPPVDSVDKVVREPMEALNQLDRAAGYFFLEVDPADVPLSPNSPSNTGSRKPPSLRSPPSIHQLRIVYKTTTNDEGQGNDTLGVQGERAGADGVQEGGGGFGIQVDHSEHTLVPDTGDLWNVLCYMEPGVSQVQSPSSFSDFGFNTVESVTEAGDAGSSLATVDLGDGVAVEGMPEDVGGFEAVAAGFFVQAPSPSSLVLDQDAMGAEVQVPEDEAMDCPGLVESLAAQQEAKLVAWRKALYRIPHKPILHHVQGEPKTNVTCMQATSMSCTMFCSEMIHARVSDYGSAVEKEKNRNYETYIHAAGDSPGCLFMTLPCLPCLPSLLYPPRTTSTPPSLFPTPLPSLSPCFAPPPSPLISRPPLHLPPPPNSFPPKHVTSLSLFLSSRLSPPPCFPPFSLSLLSLSHHFFSPCLPPLPPAPHT